MPIDMTNVPPAKSGPAVTRRKPRQSMTVKDKRTEAVGGLFQLAQFGCILMGQHADAGAIGMHADNVSSELVSLAEQDERVAGVIDGLIKTGPYAGLITAMLPLVFQIMANHKMANADKIPGVVAPETLAAQMQARIAHEAAEEIRKAQEAQQELARAQQAMNQASGQAKEPSKAA